MRVLKLRRRAIVIGLCLAIGAATLVFAATTSSGPGSYTATVTVDATAKANGDLSPQYIGLSIESSVLTSGKIPGTGDLAQFLQNLGRSVLRFGGNSADTSFTGTSLSELRGLVALANASGWSVLYTENLGKFDAARVTADASSVSSALGGKLFAFACGNEPDAYPHNGLRPHDYSVSDYLGQTAACIQAIQRAASYAPLEGPDTAGNREWFSAYATQEAGTIGWLGQHYYPMGCASPGERPANLLTALFSSSLAATEAKTLAWYVATARAAGKPLLITETNSACGGGIPGLSDAYASALWVIDYLLTGAEHGVSGMYFHTGQLDSDCVGYAVLCQTGANSYRAQPIYYGLLFTHLLGTGQFLPVKVATSPNVGNVTAFAIKPPGEGLRLMLENLSKKQLDATLQVGGDFRSASVLSLTGSNPLATSGIQIEGAAVAANGTFAHNSPSIVHCAPEGCPLTLAPYSAALITVG